MMGGIWIYLWCGLFRLRDWGNCIFDSNCLFFSCLGVFVEWNELCNINLFYRRIIFWMCESYKISYFECERMKYIYRVE